MLTNLQNPIITWILKYSQDVYKNITNNILLIKGYYVQCLLVFVDMFKNTPVFIWALNFQDAIGVIFC